MRRAGLAVLFVLGFALAGGLSTAVVASPVSSSTEPTDTTTTAPSATETTATTAAPAPSVLPPAVSIAGVPVGGLSAAEAYVAVRASFEEPLVLVLGRRRYAVAPVELGAVAYARRAVERARSVQPGSAVRLSIVVHAGRTRSYVTRLAKRFARKPVDSRLLLRRLRPFLTKDVAGRKVDRRAAVAAIVTALEAGRRGPLRLATKSLLPKVTRANFGPVIVIRRGSKRLLLYYGMHLKRTFRVATGQSVYPTPIGHFRIVVRWRNPWWFPPPSPWARGLEPIPPGPGNPLGTRWMGLSASGVGIHGTPDDASIGYSVSHGCIRMHIPAAEWLFEHVTVGTTVFIVAA